jgi:hypothetical protein
MEQWLSIPPAMTATLLRPPAGEWVYMACRTHLTGDGLGLAHADMFDRHGFVGEVAQPLLVQSRQLTMARPERPIAGRSARAIPCHSQAT